MTLLIYSAAGQQRCYGDDLGCYPYVVPLVRPESVERMEVSFRLYKTPTTDYEVTLVLVVNVYLIKSVIKCLSFAGLFFLGLVQIK